MNGAEIIAFLKEKNDSVNDYAHGGFPQELGKTQRVFSKGGEGEGEDWRRVYHFIDHNVYLEFNGHYTSYNGVDFYDGFDNHCSEVRPKEKTITVYE